MANEELIYRITRAIYERLGPSADESAVEQLVTDIYQTVAPALAGNGAARPGSVSSLGEAGTGHSSAERLIISVFGMDHPGIVAGVAQTRQHAEAVEIGERFAREPRRGVSCGDDGDDVERRNRIDS